MQPPMPIVIQLQFDPVKGQLGLSGILLNTQEQKNQAIQIFLQAINLVLSIKPTVIQPAQVIPNIPVKNGNPMKVTH